MSDEHGTADPTRAFEEKPPEDEIEDIDAERERRLDPDNRPEGAEVDNTGETLPTVEEFKDLNADDEEVEGAAGTSDPSKAFKDNPPSEEEVKEIEAERERRLDPANRPEGAEVDNTGENLPGFIKDEIQEQQSGQ
jgi:hypothetical protein